MHRQPQLKKPKRRPTVTLNPVDPLDYHATMKATIPKYAIHYNLGQFEYALLLGSLSLLWIGKRQKRSKAVFEMVSELLHADTSITPESAPDVRDIGRVIGQGTGAWRTYSAGSAY